MPIVLAVLLGIIAILLSVLIWIIRDAKNSLLGLLDRINDGVRRH